MTSNLVSITEPQVVTVADYCEHAKLDNDHTQDSSLNTYLSAATDESAMYTRRTILKSTWRAKMSSFSDGQFDNLPIDPATVVVLYYDVNNIQRYLLSENIELTENGPDDYLSVKFIGTLPTLYNRSDAVVIEYSAGYGSQNLPWRIKLGILQQAATYLEGRQSELVGAGAVGVVEFGAYHNWFPFKMLG